MVMLTGCSSKEDSIGMRSELHSIRDTKSKNLSDWMNDKGVKITNLRSLKALELISFPNVLGRWYLLLVRIIFSGNAALSFPFLVSRQESYEWSGFDPSNDFRSRNKKDCPATWAVISSPGCLTVHSTCRLK